MSRKHRQKVENWIISFCTKKSFDVFGVFLKRKHFTVVIIKSADRMSIVSFGSVAEACRKRLKFSSTSGKARTKRSAFQMFPEKRGRPLKRSALTIMKSAVKVWKEKKKTQKDRGNKKEADVSSDTLQTH